MSETETLLEEYYTHLQHSEKQRSTFLKIYLASQLGIFGIEEYIDCPVMKLFLAASLLGISLSGLEIMNKSAVVVDAYTKIIFDVIVELKPKLCVNRHLKSEKRYSKSEAYKHIFDIIVVLNILYLFYVLMELLQFPHCI